MCYLFPLRPPPRFKVEILEGSESVNLQTCNDVKNNGAGLMCEQPFNARVISNERVTSPEHWQDVRHIKFDIKHSGIR